MKLAGMIFVILSAGTVGFQMARGLRNSCESLRMLCDALQIMRSEIEVCRTPLPQVFALMAANSDGQLESIFTKAARELDRNCWLTPYEAVKPAVLECGNPQFEAILLPLSQKLGKYNLETQIMGIEAAKTQAKKMIEFLEQERMIKSRTYRTLGICAGFAVAILLV